MRILDEDWAQRVVEAALESAAGEIARALNSIFPGTLWLTGGWVRSFALERFSYAGDIDLLVDRVAYNLMEEQIKATGSAVSRTRLGGLRIGQDSSAHVDLVSSVAYGDNVPLNDSLNYVNATVNSAAIRLDCPSDMVMGKLFERDIADRTLRFLEKGLMLQDHANRARSVRNTLRLMTTQELELLTDDSFQRIMSHTVFDSDVRSECNEILDQLISMGRYREADVIKLALLDAE